MSEVEYDRLLDTVRTAVAAVPREATFDQSAKVANDNRLASSVNFIPEGCTEREKTQPRLHAFA